VQTTELEFDPVEIRMEGVFDVTAAQAVVRALDLQPFESEVRIDLTHVREFHDFAVAVLAQALAPRRDHVAVRGLRQHQLRLLTYLGLGQTVEPIDLSDSAMA